MFEMCYFSFSLFHRFLFALVSFHPSLLLSRSRLPEQRVLQRDQAGLAYWKQMADQRQEGHGFMKPASNMPGSCRGACPWTMAARCERERVCVWAFLWHGTPNRSLSFFSHLFIPARWFGWCIEDFLSRIWWLWSPLLPVSRFSIKLWIKGRCLGSIVRSCVQ